MYIEPGGSESWHFVHLRQYSRWSFEVADVNLRWRDYVIWMDLRNADFRSMDLHHYWWQSARKAVTGHISVETCTTHIQHLLHSKVALYSTMGDIFLTKIRTVTALHCFSWTCKAYARVPNIKSVRIAQCYHPIIHNEVASDWYSQDHIRCWALLHCLSSFHFRHSYPIQVGR